MSDMASSLSGGDTPRGGKAAPTLPVRPRWSDMCGDDGLLDAVAYDEELLACSDSPDSSPKSPSKGARRAQRRRRRREEVKAQAALEALGGSPTGAMSGAAMAAAAAAALEAATAPDPPQLRSQQQPQQQQPQQMATLGFVPTIQVSPVACSGPKLLLPAGALMDPGMKGSFVGNCTPTCVASPQRGNSNLFVPSSPCPGRGGAGGGGSGYVVTSPTSMQGGGGGGGSGYVVTSPTSLQGVFGSDASARTPGGNCGSSQFRRNTAPPLGTAPPMSFDASARTPTARTMPAWASPTADGIIGGASFTAAPSPNARGAGSAGSIVSTSPVGSASMRMSAASPMSASQLAASTPPSFAGSGQAPAGSAAADALRTLLGPAGMPSQDLFAKLLAAEPEAYED